MVLIIQPLGYLKNIDVSSIIIQQYLSAVSILEHERNAMYRTEYLNKLNLSGIPPHSLDLFVGCPIILLKNMTGGLPMVQGYLLQAHDSLD